MRVSSLIIASALILISCTGDAPRDNPFDPNSEVYQYAHSITGEVLRKIPPYNAIPSARVEMEPEGLVTSTDENGNFRFEHLQHDSLTLLISKEGYGAISINGAVNELPDQYYLNARPVMDSIAVVTNHISHWWPVEDEFEIAFSGWVVDADGITDIDSVWFTVPDAKISLPANGQINDNGMIRVALYDWQMDIPATDLTGMPIYGHVLDSDSLEAMPLETYTTRFIESSPTPTSPAGNEETTGFPVLRWEEFDANYTFYYHVEVFRVSSGNTTTKILGQPQIPKTEKKYSVTDSLANGSYYWTLGVYDIYGNSTHSKEATFTVVE